MCCRRKALLSAWLMHVLPWSGPHHNIYKFRTKYFELPSEKVDCTNSVGWKSHPFQTSWSVVSGFAKPADISELYLVPDGMFPLVDQNYSGISIFTSHMNLAPIFSCVSLRCQFETDVPSPSVFLGSFRLGMIVGAFIPIPLSEVIKKGAEF